MNANFTARVWGSVLIGLLVGTFGIWQALRSDLAEPVDTRVLIALLVAVAAGSYRILPGAGLALMWLAAAIQVSRSMDVALVQLAVVIVSYGAGRYGSRLTLWLSGLSIPAGSAIALWYVLRHGTATLEGLGSRIAPSGTPSDSTAFLLAFVLLAAPWAIGLLLRLTVQSRRAREERERAELEAERAQEVAQLRAEQNRLARDVHDVVGHSLAVILAQADSAQYMRDGDVERIRAALANISDSARRSLGDVRQVLSSSDDDEQRYGGAAGLDGLIDGVRTAGYDVRSDVLGVPRPLPPELDVVAFRVLQEMLTNALKHGSREGREIAVTREWGPGQLRIEVCNSTAVDAHGGGQGLGLAGMRRRLEAVGGRLEAGPLRRPDGAAAFRAAAWVPLRSRSTP
jgi:signal transduction histidine kinase